MAKVTPKFYWDACCWIGLINGEGAKHKELRLMWERAKKGECLLYTSAYTYIEVAKRTGDPLEASESDKRVDDLLDQPFVESIQVDDVVGRLARRLRRIFPEELQQKADAIHVASAAQCNVEALHTYDGSAPDKAKRMLSLNGKITMPKGGMLRICLPDVDVYGPLFGGTKDIRDGKE